MRLSKLIDRFDELGIDAMLVTDETNVRYLTEFTGDSTYLWVTPTRQTLLSDGRFETQIRDQCGHLKTLDVAIRPPSVKMHELVQQVLRSAGGNPRIGFEADHVTVATRLSWEAVDGVQWKSCSGVVESLRQIKDPGEIECIRRAINVAERAFLSFGLSDGSIDFDGTERELAFALEAEMRRLGASGASFDIIVAVDAAAALPHYQPANVPVRGAKTLLVDWGAMVDGYASDLTRTLHGTEPADEFVSVRAAVHRAHDAAVAAVHSGAIVADVDAAARKVLAEHDLAEFFVHSTGHGFGLAVHEAPRIAAGQRTELRAGMMVTIEPGVYLPDRFGIRLENDVLVTDGGSEVMSTTLPMSPFAP